MRGEPGTNYPSTKSSKTPPPDKDPETGKEAVGAPKYKIAKEQVDIGEVLNYLLETGVSE